MFVVRAFVKLRELALAHKELAVKLEELERKVAGHDEAIRSLVAAIRQLMAPPDAKPRRRIGFDVARRDDAGIGQETIDRLVVERHTESHGVDTGGETRHNGREMVNEGDGCDVGEQYAIDS